MPQLQFMLVAEGVVVDRQTNNVTLFNLVEEMRGTRPGTFPRLVVYSNWQMQQGDEDQDFQAILRVERGGTRIGEDFALNMRTPAQRHRLFHTIFGLPVEAEGPPELHFLMFLDGEQVGSYTVTIRAEN